MWLPRPVAVVAGSGQLCLRATSHPPCEPARRRCKLTSLYMNLHIDRFLLAFLLYLYEHFYLVSQAL